MTVVNQLPDDRISIPDLKNKGQNILAPAWRSFFGSLYLVSNASASSGTSGNRPAVGLWVGRRYFDTTLGKPVFVKTTSPLVWVDGAGTVS